jgi:hypothetical protein
VCCVLPLASGPLAITWHRYEDNFDPVTNLTVMVMKTDKSSITGWGSPEKFLEQHRYLLGEQVFIGACSRL